MNTTTEESPLLWAAEPSSTPGQQRIRARIAGLHCSLCTGTIEKALGRMDGVGTVAVSLTHEQALVDYDPSRVSPEKILGTWATSVMTCMTRVNCARSRRRKPTWSVRVVGCWLLGR